MMSNLENWFLAQLKPNGLQAALRNLGRQNIDAFMPLRLVSNRGGHGVSVKKKPLFPGYLFVNLDPGCNLWRKVNSTLGVARLVAFGHVMPQPLPASLMQALKMRCDQNDFLLPPDDFKVGEHVRAITGPFVDFVAKIDELTDAERVGVLFEIMGRSVKTTVPRQDLEHARATGYNDANQKQKSV